MTDQGYQPLFLGVQTGTMFIDKLAESYLRQLLKSAGLSPDDISNCTTAGIRDFEVQAKRNFCGANDSETRVEIGGSRLNIPSIRVRRGRLALTGRVPLALLHKILC